MTKLSAVVCAFVLCLPSSVTAQNSVYGIRGLGFPGQPISVRSRALGGGWAMFDNFSSVNPATTASFASLSVSAMYGTTVRNYSIDTTSVAGLVETRFPHTMLGGNIGGTPFSFAASLSTYAERSFDVTTVGTGMVQGNPVQVEDRVASDGGIVDLRGSVGWRVKSNFLLGAGFHVINGSSRITASRDFIDSQLRTFNVDTDLSFEGIGLSAGVLWRTSNSRIQLSLAGRWDDNLESSLESETTTDVDLPASVSGGVSFRLTNRVRWSTSGTWRKWSVASAELAAGLVANPVRAFDTWQVGTGIELADLETRFPLRLGARYSTLPFGVSEQPNEFVISAGTGSRFAAGRAQIDLAVERLMRQGAGATERGWHFTVGITVTP